MLMLINTVNMRNILGLLLLQEELRKKYLDIDNGTTATTDTVEVVIENKMN